MVRVRHVMKTAARLFSVLLMAGVSSATAACSTPAADDDARDDSNLTSNVDGAPKLCAAVRGNGQYIVTHFASLARIIEHYGVVEGMAGGSSGSISTFVYESMLKNPAVAKCGTEKCSAPKYPARLSLALKSVQGYGQNVWDSEEAVAIRDLAGITARLKKEVDERGIGALVSTDATLAAKKLLEVLEIPEVRAIVNPDVFPMLRDVEHLKFNVKEIYTSIVTLGAFSVDDNRLFFRTGIFNWDELATLFGRVADFYAGYGAADKDATAAWLDGCADAAIGKPWEQAVTVPFPGGGTCGEAFSKIATDYRAKVRASGAQPQRLSERVGDPSPLHKLVSTSVLEGKAIAAYKQARAAYASGAYPTGNIPFDISFDDVKFGYWGSDPDLGAVTSDRLGFGDLKTKKATSLGNGTWREILTRSPAEPGLSRLVELPDGRISAGGWSDLSPTQVLKNIGCERVVYVTRESDEGDFATKVAKNLGMDEATWKSLYDLGDPTSSFNVALESADGVWCTNWNALTSFQQRELALDSWGAPLETHAGFEGIPTLSPYGNTTPRTGKPGCTPNVSGNTPYPR